MGVFPSGVPNNNDGYTVICPSSSKSITVSATNATTFSWVPTGSVNASPATSSTTTVSASASAGGSVLVSVDNACQAPQTATLYVSSSVPTISGGTINGVSNSGSLYILYGFSSAQMAVSTPVLSTVCVWTKNAPMNSNNIYPNYNTCLGYVAPNSYLNVTVNTSNSCGSGASRNFSIYRPTGSLMAVSPNPATTTLNVTLDKEIANTFLQTLNLVSDSRSTVVRNFDVAAAKRSNYFNLNNTVDFDVANLPRGVYHVVMSLSDGKTVKETVVLR